jgi:hypothetical protein
MDVNSLTPAYFEWVVEHMADMAIRLATLPPGAERPETAIPPLVAGEDAGAAVVPLATPAAP